MTKAEQKLALYVSLFITLIFNASKLMALRESALITHYWKFNGYELLFQTLLNFVFCYYMCRLNLRLVNTSFPARWQKPFLMVWVNLLLLLLTCALGINMARFVFSNTTPLPLLRATHFIRLLASLALVLILVRMMILLRQKAAGETENEHLRNAFLSAQLSLLKEQLNPHFFFNALSSLSAVIRESPALAQHYIAHLSKVFRYALEKKDKNLVTLEEELAALHSYNELLKMRFENHLHVQLSIPPEALPLRLPHMSLQPLLENVVKHNVISLLQPLEIAVTVQQQTLEVKNAFSPHPFPEEGTGTGLANLNERFLLLTGQHLTVEHTKDYFSVKLPLVP